MYTTQSKELMDILDILGLGVKTTMQQPKQTEKVTEKASETVGDKLKNMIDNGVMYQFTYEGEDYIAWYSEDKQDFMELPMDQYQCGFNGTSMDQIYDTLKDAVEYKPEPKSQYLYKKNGIYCITDSITEKEAKQMYGEYKLTKVIV